MGTFLNITILLSTATAQEAIISAGINVSGNAGSMSYSVGQVVYQNHTGTNGSLAEGVQQPYRISVTYKIDKSKQINLSFLAFPNPVSDFLYLNVENYNNENISFQVADMQGKVLHIQGIFGSQTFIDVGNLPSATYFVHVILDNKLVKTFKIIKS